MSQPKKLTRPINNFPDFNASLPKVQEFVIANSGVPLELTIAVVDKDKTQKQLGGLFANYITYLSTHDYELSLYSIYLKENPKYTGSIKDYLHGKLKSMFLAHIYAEDVQNETVYGDRADSQIMWVKGLINAKIIGNREDVIEWSKGISLSWSNLSQMKRYMDSIVQHYQSLEIGLPEMETKDFKDFKARTK